MTPIIVFQTIANYNYTHEFTVTKDLYSNMEHVPHLYRTNTWLNNLVHDYTLFWD